MAAPRKYPDALRERAVRMAVDLRRDPATRTGALRRVGEQLGINPETLRNRVTQAEIDAGDRTRTTSDEARRVLELEQEVRELRRANEILKTASAFRRGGARPPTAVIVDYIDAHLTHEKLDLGHEAALHGVSIGSQPAERGFCRPRGDQVPRGSRTSGLTPSA